MGCRFDAWNTAELILSGNHAIDQQWMQTAQTDTSWKFLSIPSKRCTKFATFPAGFCN
jgi:hypothetical protein